MDFRNKILFMLFIAITVIAKGQVFVPGEEGLCVDGKANLHVAAGATLHIDGNFYNKKSQGALWVRSYGVISLTGNLTCNDPLICERASSLTPTSQFIFSPKSPTVSITSTTDSLVLYHAIINKPNAVVKVSSGVKLKILDTLDLQAGSLQLDGGNVYFSFHPGTPSYANHPYLKNENHNNRIFGDSGLIQISTNISAAYTPSSPINLANLGLVLKGSSVPNTTITIKRGHAKQLYAGNGSITRYFDVSTNQPLVNNDSVFVDYIDSAEYINLGIDKNKLKLFVSAGDDMDYSQITSFNLLSQHIAKGTTTDFSALGISPTKFRITVADEGCLNPPVSSLPNGTITLCSGVTQLLDAGNNNSVPNTNVIWNWSTGATTQTIAVTGNTATQQIIVELKDVRGCLTKDTVYIAPTAPSPIAQFANPSKCFGDTVKLLSTSTISSGTITNFQWQFGDGASINLTQNDTVKKLYNAAGNYSVTLNVTSNFGCAASITKNIVSLPLPIAGFSSSFNCSNRLMEFTNTSTVNPISGAITQTNWNFDLGSSSLYTPYSPTVSPTYSYSAGTYTVKLLAQTGLGCKDSTTQTVVINQKNSSSFSVSNSCLGDTVSFINNSLCNTGNCNYIWDFGDGTQSIAVNPKKIFSTATAYNVKLKILNVNSCTDSISVPIIIYPKAVVDFSATAVCFGETNVFINNSSISTGSITSYNWDFGNTVTSSGINATQLYANDGIYNVTLSATSNFGCVSKLTKQAIVYPKPTAQYNVSNVCIGQSSLFNENSIGTSLNYLWDFGNTVSSNVVNPTYQYPNVGTYTTNLYVADINGCKDTSTVITTIYSKPNINLGGTITTCGTSYLLDAGVSGLNYMWQPLNVTTQTLTVSSNGVYSLTATDVNGCISNNQVSVVLNSIVKPHLGNDTSACGSIVLNAGYPGASYVWSNSSVISQTLLATNPSTYIVTVTDINSCIGTDTIIVSINTPPTLSLGADITQCKSTQPISITPITNATTFTWSNGTTLPNLITNTSGNYILTVTAANGCKLSDTITVNLLSTPIVNLGLDATACGTKLLDAQNAGFNYLWSNNNTSQTINATANGSYWVEVTNPLNNCVGKDTINLTINAPINLNLGNDTTTCSNNTFVLNAGNIGANYNWSTGANTQTILVGSSGAYGVMVSNGVCSAFDVININVVNAPIINLGSNIHYICGNSSVVLNTGNSNPVSWGSNFGFNSTQNSITVTQAGIYWAVASNGACSSSDTVQVFQSNQDLTAYFIASTIDTVGTPVKFVDVSEPTPTSWFWDFGDGFYSNLQSPVHTYLIPQTFNVSLTVSNGFCTSQIVKSVSVFRLSPVVAKANPSTLELVNFSVYPNPASTYFKTLLELNDLATINFSVYEITGKLVYKQTKNESSILDEDLNLSNLSNGLYMIEVVAENAKGFVKQKNKLIIMK